MTISAANAARLGAAVYKDWLTAELDAWEMGYDLAVTIGHADRQTMSVRHRTSGERVLVFRGTESTKAPLRDLWSNFVVPVPWCEYRKERTIPLALQSSTKNRTLAA